MKVKTSEVVFDSNVYPRFDMDNDVVNRYMTAIENLPPIIISADNRLIDGKHRLRAYQLSGIEEIEVDKLNITDDTEILKEAIKRNSTHGQQLEITDKKANAQKLYPNLDGDSVQKIAELVNLLSVSERSVYDWTEAQREDEKKTEEKAIVSLYLKCWKQQKIADELKKGIGTINRAISKIADMQKWKIPPDSLQLYDIWNFGKLDQQYGQDYAGRIPGQIIENVLWYWTKPFDVVIDPMVGGGTTIDVCKAMYRRYQGYDKNKVHDDTIIHDLTTGIPEQFEKADLVFMDPPYFKKKADEYNLPEEYNTKSGFLAFAQKWVDFTNDVLKKDGIVALLISDYVDYENPDESIFSYEYARLFKKYKMLYKISVPLSTQQYQAFHVGRAKENKQILIVGRELYVMRKN